LGRNNSISFSFSDYLKNKPFREVFPWVGGDLQTLRDTFVIDFVKSKKINFNSIRKGGIIGEHEDKFSSGKEVITLNHEAFDRALYSEGAFTAAKWLMNKKPGLYSMRDVLNFK